MKNSVNKNSLTLPLINKLLIIIFLVSSFSFAEEGEWKKLETTNSPTERVNASFVSQPDGKVVLFGGEGPQVDLLNDLYVFQENEWTEVEGDPNNQPPERKNAASWAGEDKLYIHGGEGASGEILDDMWIYDFYVNQWDQVELDETNPGALTRHSAVVFDDGKVLISGGMTGPNHYSSNTYLFDPITNTFLERRRCPFPTSEQSMMNVGEEAFPLQVFGENQEMVFYNKSSDQWSYYMPDAGTEHPGLMASAAYSNALDNGLYVIGGEEYHDGVGYEKTKTVWQFNAEDKSWSEIAALPEYRLYSSAVFDPTRDRLLLFGGKDETGNYVNSMYEYPFNPTSIDDDSELVNEFKLEQNYPNPFNPTTNIKYRVSSIENVILTVYNFLGEQVAILVNEQKSPGVYEAKFSVGSLGNASNLSSGVYFYRITAGNFSQTKKMMMLK